MSDERLAARIKARNKASKLANELYLQLKPIFVPFVGKKILTATGSLIAKVKLLIPDLTDTPSVRICPSGRNSLSWTVYVSETDHRGNIYEEVNVYIGQLKDGILTKLNQHETLQYRTDYTEEEITSKRKDCAILKKAFEDAQSDLFPFGEYDR